MPWHDLFFYMMLVIGFALTPGPNMMLYLTHTFEYGRKAGWATVAGITSAFLFHVTAVVFGLTTLLLQRPQALDILRYAGIIYLLYLAWQNLKYVAWRDGNGTGEKVLLREFYWKGMVGNLLNPGSLVLYFSVIPQFIHPERGFILRQNITLCLLQMLGSTVTNSVIVYLAGFAGPLFKTEQYQRRIRIVMSILIAAFALKLLFFRN